MKTEKPKPKETSRKFKEGKKKLAKAQTFNIAKSEGEMPEMQKCNRSNK